MKQLIIGTGYPTCVLSLLVQNEFVEKGRIISHTLELIIDYPDDALSQALVLWFALAKGCGLVDRYMLVEPKENPFGD